MVFAPAATPKALIDRLNLALAQALTSPALRDRMTKEGFEPTPSTPALARARLEKEMPQWAKLVKDRGITAE
jgi:tripartite-type tricarboxylate transporter receptor subunit TctC